MTDFDPRHRELGSLRDAGRHAEALALLQHLFDEVEDGIVPARSGLFIPMLEWRFLGEVHAPAQAALREQRDRQVARLLAGDQYVGAGVQAPESLWHVGRFSLIVDMNAILGDPGATRDLFLQLDAAQPALARRYAWQALPDIVAAGDFALAERYRKNPLELLNQVNAAARRYPLFPQERQAPRLAAELSNLTRDVGIGIAVLRGTGREQEADSLRTALLAGLESGELRALAQRELEEQGTIQGEIARHRMAQEGHDLPD
ncbi:hypothetical protein HH212_22160 [Massilia forsythiae]|uniref:Uncharacterized protein n=1 Tax=Massilia forsythiae TaxID=2728020 RepID=A0A7Z2W0W2_9BURK|nr:hypothetical protein [Massilia forsythiae]QJE02392.1 hypothetical protein HH212_22160 [Massilia forsythiae]